MLMLWWFSLASPLQPSSKMTTTSTLPYSDTEDTCTSAQEKKMTIREFFAGQRVFITGGTGFIGKVLIEKMLRSCPEVECVYIAIRPKKGVSHTDRWEQTTQLPIFDKLKKENPEALKKVKLISADMKCLNLGMSEEDREELINNVTIVYHVAATVQFADNIIDALEQNTRATYIMAELAKRIVNLKVMVYVSTCYTNFFRPKEQWDEKLYPAVQDWRVILRLLETEPLQLANLKEKLLSGHPNPYTFSKSLAEQIVYDYSSQFTTAIVRPSVVMPALEEPLRGWVDSLNGMAVLCIANSFGILRVARHSNEAHQDYVPVDVVAKFLFAATWATANMSEKDQYPPIYNTTVGELMTIRMSDISRITTKAKFIEATPSKYIVWTRDLKLIKNPIKFQILFFLEQVIPACLFDIAIYLYGAQPLFVKIARKLAYANQILFKDFVFSEIHFKNEKFLKLAKSLEGDDKLNFGVRELDDVSSFKLEGILGDVYIGVLKYFFKEDLCEKNIVRNKKRYNRIKMLSTTLSAMFYCGLACLIYSYLWPYAEDLWTWLTASTIITSPAH